jgi:hypothetical protein
MIPLADAEAAVGAELPAGQAEQNGRADQTADDGRTLGSPGQPQDDQGQQRQSGRADELPAGGQLLADDVEARRAALVDPFGDEARVALGCPVHDKGRQDVGDETDGGARGR